jgi:hypothetical protein
LVRPQSKHLACASSMPLCRPSCAGAERSARARRAGSTRGGAAAADEASVTGPRPWRWRGGRGGRKRRGRTTAPPCSCSSGGAVVAACAAPAWRRLAVFVTRQATTGRRVAKAESCPCLAEWASWRPRLSIVRSRLIAAHGPWDRGSLGRGFGHVGAGSAKAA